MRRDLWTWVLVGVFIVAPIVNILYIEPAERIGERWTAITFLAASLLAGVVAAVLLGIALASSLFGRRTLRRLQDLERQQNLTALGAGFLVAMLALAQAPANPVVAGIYTTVALAYALMCVPTSSRRLEYRLSRVVRCSPGAAFDLVSDPRNWHRYFPQMEVEPPLQLPLRVGSIVHAVWAQPRLAFSEDEEVIAFEPGRRFGTASAHGRPNAGVYEFTPVTEGTNVAWTYWSVLSYANAVLGGALRRGALVERMIERRSQSFERIAQILEAPSPAPV